MARCPSARGSKPLGIGVIRLLAALAFVPAASAQISPHGPELQVNSYTRGIQRSSAVASGPRGSVLMVVWSSGGSGGTDRSGASIQARLFAQDGTPLGPQFQVNTYTFGHQYWPRVASDAEGNFVVAWHSYGSSGTDTSGPSVQAQLLAPDGTPIGGEFQVNTYTPGYQRLAAVSRDAQGSFVVVWTSTGSSGTDTSAESIQGQCFDADGTPLGDEFQVNTYTTSTQYLPAVALQPQGHFVVTWNSLGSDGTDTHYWSVQAQRFGPGGTPLGSQFQVNSYTTGTQFGGAVASEATGRFVVSWGSAGSSGGDTDGSVQAQRFDAAGTPLGGEFQVNSYGTGRQFSPAVASDESGDFVVAWTSYGSSGTDTSDRSIQGQRFDANGTARGQQFQVNTYTTSRQYHPNVASDESGNFVVAWTSHGSSGTDTSYTSIQAQLYDGLFRDGFEAGDSSRWSSTLP